MKLTPQELNAMLKDGGIPGMEPADYDEGQEDANSWGLCPIVSRS
jgi:hypothetical protein